MLAELHEESIPAQDLAAPSPAAATSPGAATAPAADTDEDTNPDSGEWTAVPAGRRRPPIVQVPVSNPMPPAAQPPPADIAPALDAGSIATTPANQRLVTGALDRQRADSRPRRVVENHRAGTRRARPRPHRRRDSRAGACDLDRSEQLVRVLLFGARVHCAQGLRAGADVFQARGNRSRVEFRVARRDLRVRGRVPRAVGKIRRRCGRVSEGARGKSGQPDGARRRHAAVRIHASLDHAQPHQHPPEISISPRRANPKFRQRPTNHRSRRRPASAPPPPAY